MRLRLNKKQSVVFTVFYVFVTMVLRFLLEPYLAGYYLISIGIGLYFVLLYWVLLHKKILNFHEEDGGSVKA